MCLPRLAIGSFEMTSSSSTQVVVVMHLMEAMMLRVRDLISEMGGRRLEQPAAVVDEEDDGRGEFIFDTPSGQWPLNSQFNITEVTLRAIQTREEATMKLLATVRRLVFQVGIL